ncbi:MAG: hypothetical protein JWM93_868 [Frankiales bacterium]|nr:hypothetical protein [Frankiales bacterium]
MVARRGTMSRAQRVAYTLAVAADTPVGYWRLNDASGTTAADSAGTNPGTYTGTYTLRAASLMPLETGSASVSAAGAGHIIVPDNAVLRPTAAVTCEAWFASSTGAVEGLVSRWNTAGYLLRVGNDAGNFIEFRIQNTAMSFTLPALFDGTPRHIVGTYDGTNGRIYVNGALVAGPTAQPALTAPATINAELGSYNGGSGKLNGRLSDCAIYNTALSAARIAAHYAAATT